MPRLKPALQSLKLTINSQEIISVGTCEKWTGCRDVYTEHSDAKLGSFPNLKGGKTGFLLPHPVKLGSLSLFFFLEQRMSKKKVMSVLWQEWQVWGIITETWKVCVSTSGHLRRIDPHRAAAGLMSTVSPASNEERAIATVFHQPSALSVQHPIIPEHTAWAAEQHRISCHTSMKKQYGVGEGICEMALSQVQSWKHCD